MIIINLETSEKQKNIKNLILIPKKKRHNWFYKSDNLNRF